MYCLLTRVAVRCQTERWESMNLEGSQYDIYIYIYIYIPLENNRNRTNHDISCYMYWFIVFALNNKNIFNYLVIIHGSAQLDIAQYSQSTSNLRIRFRNFLRGFFQSATPTLNMTSNECRKLKLHAVSLSKDLLFFLNFLLQTCALFVLYVLKFITAKKTCCILYGLLVSNFNPFLCPAHVRLIYL